MLTRAFRFSPTFIKGAVRSASGRFRPERIAGNNRTNTNSGKWSTRLIEYSPRVFQCGVAVIAYGPKLVVSALAGYVLWKMYWWMDSYGKDYDSFKTSVSNGYDKAIGRITSVVDNVSSSYESMKISAKNYVEGGKKTIDEKILAPISDKTQELKDKVFAAFTRQIETSTAVESGASERLGEGLTIVKNKILGASDAVAGMFFTPRDGDVKISPKQDGAEAIDSKTGESKASAKQSTNASLFSRCQKKLEETRIKVFGGEKKEEGDDEEGR